MKFLILGLSATLGTLSGLFYDIHTPFFTMLPIALSGPAMATAFAVFLIIASLLLGVQMIMSKIDVLTSSQRRTAQPELEFSPKLDLLTAQTTQARPTANENTKPIRLPIIDLQNLELRAERVS